MPVVAFGSSPSISYLHTKQCPCHVRSISPPSDGATWRLFVDEFGSELRYVPGERNMSADALSRLPFDEECLQKTEIPAHQWASQKKRYFGRTQLIVNCRDRIMVPPSLCEPILNWYHEMLGHPGAVRLEKTLPDHFACPGLQEDVLRLFKPSL